MPVAVEKHRSVEQSNARAGPAAAKPGAPCARRRWPTTSARCAPASKAGSYKPLAENDLERIHEAVLTLLETVGFANAIPSCIEALTRVGATYGDDGRIRFPRAAGADDHQERGAQLHAPRPGPEARHGDPGQARALRHGRCGGASGRCREARISRSRCCRTSTTPRASSTGSTTSISSSARWCRATFPIRSRWISTRSMPA